MEKHFAVIGDPIAHSLSPQMHRAGFDALGLNAEYQRFHVIPAELKKAVQGLKSLGFAGWNVTLPHKEGIVPLLDDLAPAAQKAGAVNTVKVENGRLIGHNTDGLGFWQALKDKQERLMGREAVILGAGGAAKGIGMVLAEQGMKVNILNRSVHKAEELAETIVLAGGTAVAGELKRGPWLESAALVVQTTSVGLKGEPFPISLQGLSPQAMAVDIIFRPKETAFLREAKSLGCETENGLGMLLYQGALAWEFWWGREAPVEAMRMGLEKAMG